MDQGNRELPAEIAETPPLIPELALPAPRWRSLSALITVIILLLVLTGVLLNIHFKYAHLESELNRYEKLWNEQEIPSYNFELTAGTSWGHWHETIQVRTDNGTITSKTISEDGDITSMIITEENIGQKRSWSDYNTVEKLFTTIRGAIEEREYNIKVTYNQDLGYPVDVFVDTGGIDNLWGFSVADFYIPDSNYLQRESELYRLKSELDEYRRLWNGQAISNYDYVLTKITGSGYCKAIMQVRKGVPRSELIFEYDRGLDPYMYLYNTISILFDHIRDAITVAIRDGVDIIEITYDTSLGYPLDVYVDPSLTVSEDEYGISVSDFHITESGE